MCALCDVALAAAAGAVSLFSDSVWNEEFTTPRIVASGTGTEEVCSVTLQRMANIMQNMAQSSNIPRVSPVFSFWSEDVLLFIYS